MPGQKEETRSGGDDHPDTDQHYQIAATSRYGHAGAGVARIPCGVTS